MTNPGAQAMLADSGAYRMRDCPFCGSEIRHVESWAKSFDPPRLYHEWHHDETPCQIHYPQGGTMVANATDDPKMQARVIRRWNTRAASAIAVRDRDAIARIIDPDLFIEYDLLVTQGTIAENGKPWAEVVFGQKIARLHAKADAILSLATPEIEIVCAEAYQVVGTLLSDTGQFDTEHGNKILDNLSQARMVHDDVLPWKSVEASTAAGEAEWHEDFQERTRAIHSTNSAVGEAVAWRYRHRDIPEMNWRYSDKDMSGDNGYVCEPLYAVPPAAQTDGVREYNIGSDKLCDDCPPPDYPTDKTRCLPCPRRQSPNYGTK